MWGFITTALALSAFIITVYKFMLIKHECSAKKIFLPEALVYLMTALFGLATMVGLSADNILYPARCIALILVIYSSRDILRKHL